MRLMTIRNGLKRAISTNGGLEFLPISLTKRLSYVRSHIGKENETLFIRVWRPLHSRRVKNLKRKLKEDNIC